MRSFAGQLAWALLAGAGCALPAGCASSPERPIVLLVSGDTAGWIVPCGCTSNQSGGLPRRGTFVAQQRLSADAIVADVGGAVAGTSAYDQTKLEAILRGELQMNIAAHNVGAGELALGPQRLRDLATRLGVPLVSANTTDAQEQPLADPVRVVTRGRDRVALIGVVSPKFATEKITVHPPRQAVLDAIASLETRCRAIVVLAYLPEDELHALAAELPEVDAIVGGPTGQSVPPRQVGPTLLTSATNKGKFLAKLTLPDDDRPEWHAEIVELDATLADDDAQIENLRNFRERLAELDFTPADTSLVERLPVDASSQWRIAGSDACRRCHETDHALWTDSAHARAWPSLEATGAHVDSDCQQCHTTGYGLPGGFLSARRSPDHVNVGCESCHGPSAAHAEQPRRHTAHFERAMRHCTGCHDRENSPAFDEAEYWAKIQHGQTPANEPTEPGRGDEVP